MAYLNTYVVFPSAYVSFVTTVALFIFLTVYVINSIDKENKLDSKIEVEYTFNEGTNSIYLLNKNGYLVKAKTLITSKDKTKQIESILNSLTIGNDNSFPDELKGTIPKNTKVLEIRYDKESVTINFSKEFLNLKKDIEKKTIESIVYSIFDLKEVKEIYIEVEGKLLNEYPNSKEKIYYPLNKDIGINNEYSITSRNDINKTVIYYLEKINNENYYVPVTKYENNRDDKIKVVIDSLTTNYIYEPNLMSVLNTNLKLNSYNKEDNVFFLDFNNYLYDKNQKLVEEVIYSISYSVFDNYDVNNIVFMVDGKNVKSVMLSDVK